jgi:hypothetical protein
LEKSLENAKNRAVKSKPHERQAARDEAKALTAELAEFKDLHPYRLMVDDTTPEKLIEILDKQNGCITIASAEGGIFDAISGGRYEKSLNLDVYLKAHAGDPIAVDRIIRGTNRVPNPRLTMLLTVQPQVLSGLMENSTLRGRGLCGRFLYAVCKSKVGYRDVDPAPIPTQVKAEYNQFIKRILAGQDKGVLRLSPEANAIRVSYSAGIEARLGDAWEHMRDWGGKAVGAMLRIAALIHAAEAVGKPSETPISEDTITAAIKVIECLGTHAMAAYQSMGADESQANAKYVLSRLKKQQADKLTKTDIVRLCRKFNSTQDLTEP